MKSYPLTSDNRIKEPIPLLLFPLAFYGIQEGNECRRKIFEALKKVPCWTKTRKSLNQICNLSHNFTQDVPIKLNATIYFILSIPTINFPDISLDFQNTHQLSQILNSPLVSCGQDTGALKHIDHLMKQHIKMEKRNDI